MSIKVFAYVENNEGIYNKTAFETVTYARYIANQLKTEVIALSINPISSSEELYRFGANEVIELHSQELKIFDPSVYAKALIEYFSGNYFIFTYSNNSNAVAAQISEKKNIPLITCLMDFPSKIKPFTVKRKFFSGKGIMEVISLSDSVLLSVLANSVGIIENPVEGICKRENLNLGKSKIVIHSIKKSSNKISLKDAEIVVSGGRGLKSQNNWTMIESLAEKLNAALACSKPVSDLGWRPHSEHVGQTGKTIAPNLYFAIGISGAIQHISGVNQSKIIIVINSDPEAPFFKSADYGIIGDAFEIVPKIINEFLN